MKIIKEEQGSDHVLETRQLDPKHLPNIGGVSSKILSLLSQEPMYPKQLAKALNVHEQNIYYYIRKLLAAEVITVERQEIINGTTANFYTIASDSFFIKFKDWRVSSKIHEKEAEYLKPFIENGELKSLIVVGSPDPHGPLKARSRDGYFGMDLALFLGTFISYIPESKVRLDTEITESEIKSNNLIVIGGPIVNKVSGMVNSHMPIYFDEKKKGIYSKITKQTYVHDEIGIINKFPNPYDPDKMILLIMGIRNAGTKAAIMAFLKQFEQVKLGNKHRQKLDCRVVEGIDLDSDGIVDDVEFLE